MIAVALTVLFLVPGWLPLMALDQDQPCCGEGKFCCCLLFKLTGRSRSEALARGAGAHRAHRGHHADGAASATPAGERATDHKASGRAGAAKAAAKARSRCSLGRAPRPVERPSVVSQTFGLRLGWLPGGPWVAEATPPTQALREEASGLLPFEIEPETPPPEALHHPA